MNLLTHFSDLIGPTFPLLLTVSVLAWGTIFVGVFKCLFRSFSLNLRIEILVLEWLPNASMVLGILGTLLAMGMEVFPEIKPGDPEALSKILSGLGHAMFSTVAGLIIAGISDLGMLVVRSLSKEKCE